MRYHVLFLLFSGLLLSPRGKLVRKKVNEIDKGQAYKVALRCINNKGIKFKNLSFLFW